MQGLTEQKHHWPALEIIVFDDCSTNLEIQSRNRTLANGLNNLHYKELATNVGRSRIRNLMAVQSQYSHLILLDADSRLPDTQFLERYYQLSQYEVVYGGTIYPKKPEHKELQLHYRVGLSREAHPALLRNRKPYRYFTLNNVMVSRKLLIEYPLYNQLKSYGHEDTLWVQHLKAVNIPVLHTDNPVEHTGLEQAVRFLEKSKEAIENLYLLYSNGLLLQETPLLRQWKQKRVPWLTLVSDDVMNRLLIGLKRQLCRYNMPIALFDVYKLLCLEQAHRQFRRATF